MYHTTEHNIVFKSETIDVSCNMVKVLRTAAIVEKTKDFKISAIIYTAYIIWNIYII